MKMRKLLCILSVSIAVASGCKKASEPVVSSNPLKLSAVVSSQNLEATTVNSTLPTNIIWDNAGARKISDNEYFADCARIQRMANGNLILVYGSGTDASHTRVNIIARRSSDNGVTWTTPQTVINGLGLTNYNGFANPGLLVMQNGWIMLAFEGKGKPDDNAHDNIQFCLSKDNGLTWGAPQIVASGRAWEPAMIQLSDGDIEMFWSSEARWWPGASPEQEILFSHSTDNGATWSTPMTVAYTAGKRDGMPAPLVLANNGGIAFAIEPVGQSFGPDIVWSSTTDRWNYPAYGTYANGHRWIGPADGVVGRAPSLTQISTGETVLSFMASDGRSTGGDFKKNVQLAYMTDQHLKNFRRINDPWPGLPDNEGTYYSSLFIKDASHLVLVTTRNRPDGHSEVWWKEGQIADPYSKTTWSVKAVSSEDSANSYYATSAIDENKSTWWIPRYSTNPTNYPDHYIIIDMGTQRAVSGIIISQKVGARHVKTFKVYGSADNITYTDRGTFTLKDVDTVEQLFPLTSTYSFRYLKIWPTSGYDSQPQPAFAEIGTYKLR